MPTTYEVTKVELTPALGTRFCGVIFYRAITTQPGNDPDIVTNLNRTFAGTDLTDAQSIVATQVAAPDPDV